MTIRTYKDLISQLPSTGLGAVVLIQGGEGTGKSTLAANVDGPVAYINLDWNLRYVEKHIKKDAQIDWFHIQLPKEASLSERQEVVKHINMIWNAFTTGAPSSFGTPYASCVFDTATILWDFLWPVKVEERILQGSNKNREPGPLDYRDANEWMHSIASSRASYRPDAYVIMLVHEEPLYVTDPKNPDSGFKILDPRGRVKLDGWKHSAKAAQLYMRLTRPEKAMDRNGKPKPFARTGEVLKFSDDETLMMSGEVLREPTWEDLKEILNG